MPNVTISLNISSDEYLRFYEGSAELVVAQAKDGRTVQFPANLLRQFVTHEGIVGQFIIEYDAQGKFSKILKV